MIIYKVWCSKLFEVFEKGMVVELYVEVKGMFNWIKWMIVWYKFLEGMMFNGDGVGGVKVKLIVKVVLKEYGFVVSFDVYFGGLVLFGLIGMIVVVVL